MRILLGVCGGIAAYKAISLLRLLRESGHAVRVVPTVAALNFVGAATFEALSGEPVTTDVFDDVPAVGHVALGQGADLVIVAPATADFLARAACGRADDLLTSVLLTARCPVVMAPAMHTEMWQHPATAANVATLRTRGVEVMEPASGRLTGADSGPGRLAEPEQIAEYALGRAGVRDLSGLRVLVSAGGTREAIDPVRFIGNKSSGRQGVQLAAAARDRGAEVTVVAANVSDDILDVAAGVQVIPVESAIQLRDAVCGAAPGADVVVMAAAVADYRPGVVRGAKIKKDARESAPTIALVENPDVLVELVTMRRDPRQVIVGFAAETGDDTGSVVEHGVAKARRKGADLLVINAVGPDAQGRMRGFSGSDNEAVIVDRDGQVIAEVSGSKRHVADRVWDAVLGCAAHRPGSGL